MRIHTRRRSRDRSGPICVGAGTSPFFRDRVYESCSSRTGLRCWRGGVANILRVRARSHGGACICWSRRGECWGETDRGTRSGATINSSSLVCISVAGSRNWVFLGDSLTEGVGSKRISHVSELAKRLPASEFRLRPVDAINGYVEFNVAGMMQPQSSSDLWLWNLACEGKTIESDFEWLPLISALRPELVVVFRGSLESILRPAMVFDGSWPWWVPRSWRSYSAMDPRCYFSTTWWRKAKQTSVDALKQKARLGLLRR